MLEVLLTTEGTYPYNRGGVGTWCDTLVQRTEGVRFHVMSVIANPFVPRRFRVPAHVLSVTPIPLWGTEEPTEHLDLPFATLHERRMRTTPEVIGSTFLPLFDELLEQLWRSEPDAERVARLVWRFHRFFQSHDYRTAFKSDQVWDRFKAFAIERSARGQGPAMSLRDMLQGLSWLYRFFIVLATPVPRVDLVHSSAAAFCALPAIVSKLEYGTPVLMTEHGVYLREQYLSIGKSDLSPFGKFFLLGLVGAVSRASLWASDQVSPVAAYNLRWEAELGVPREKFHVIYNGVDPTVFEPRPRPADAPLTVVSVARIDPIKDIETLLRAAALVHQEMPEVRFVVYGSVTVEEYYKQMLVLRKELGLEAAFSFAGHLSSPAAAYQSGDLIALSSISEGFPYAVVEGMMSERAVVATDVGGTSEALGQTGILVPPRSPDSMAEALLRLLRDPVLRLEMAEEGRNRALAHFTVDRQIEAYQRSYRRLTARVAAPALAPAASAAAAASRLRHERAAALLLAGDPAAALQNLLSARREESHPGMVPVLMLRQAQACLQMGRIEEAWVLVERAEALMLLQEIAA